jgi:hypothetical protein
MPRLGHPGRMAVFRLLMRFAPQSVRPTEIAEALGLKRTRCRIISPTSRHLNLFKSHGLASPSTMPSISTRPRG